jgi:hypothetical protein
VEPQVQNVIAKTVSFRNIVVGPRGCDNGNPLLAVESSNCALSDDEAINHRNVI